MIRPLRPRDRAGLLLLSVACAAWSGCSATHGSRLRPVEGAKTTASVGDQVLPPTVGSPGSRVAAADPEPEPNRNPGARISGRVVDGEGRPVAGATVRLADGSTKAGRDVRAVTDPAGGFTLNNLRPGSGYYLVAEADFADDRGTLVGRAKADTAERGVQIRLGDVDSEVTPSRAAQEPRARAVSSQVDDFATPPPEDVDAPAPAPRPARTRPKGLAGALGWRRPGSAPKAGAEVEAEPAAADDLDLTDDGAAAGSIRSPRGGAEDEGEANPLPLSIPPRASTGVAVADDEPRQRPRSRRPQAASPAPVEPETADGAGPAESGMLEMPSASSLGAASAPPALPEAPRGLDLDAAPAPTPGKEPTPAPAPAPSGPAPTPEPPPATAAAPDVAPGDPSANYNPFATVAEPARPAEPASSAPAPRTLPAAAPVRRPAADPSARPAGGIADPADSEASPSDDAAAADLSVPTRKWGEVAAVEGKVTGGSTSTAAATSRAATAKRTSDTASTARAGRFAGRRVKAEPPTGKADPASTCEVDMKSDPNQMRLVDFQLPALDGQPVRFRDLDADYVLLDFWGTWCRPCLDAVPHLNEIQQAYGPNRLKVVGIACEKNAPARRKTAVAQAAQQLGIEYPVVLTGLDDDCPVLANFQVTQYPTMILLDRSGRVLWRAVGWTESNQSRLDKVLKATLDPAHAPKPAANVARAGVRGSTVR